MREIKRLYYYTPAKYALLGIRDRRLKSTELEKANDPYESLPFGWENTVDEDGKVFLDIKKGLSEDLQMLCLSKTSKSPLMWGHYSDNCKGICLGFDVDICGDKKRWAFKVKYIKNRFDMRKFGFYYDDGELKNEDSSKIDMLHYKSHNWRYEKEWRIWNKPDDLELDAITGRYFFPFGSSLQLREILIGFRCEEENIERRIRRLTDKYPNSVEIVRTRLSSSTFAIKKI